MLALVVYLPSPEGTQSAPLAVSLLSHTSGRRSSTFLNSPRQAVTPFGHTGAFSKARVARCLGSPLGRPHSWERRNGNASAPLGTQIPPLPLLARTSLWLVARTLGPGKNDNRRAPRGPPAKRTATQMLIPKQGLKLPRATPRREVGK
jgi:hypothetical protein